MTPKHSKTSEQPYWIFGKNNHSWFPTRCKNCWQFPIVIVKHPTAIVKACPFCNVEEYV